MDFGTCEYLTYCFLYGIKSQTLKWPDDTNALHGLVCSFSDLMAEDYEGFQAFQTSEAFKLKSEYSKALYHPEYVRMVRDFIDELKLPPIRDPLKGISQLLGKYEAETASAPKTL